MPSLRLSLLYSFLLLTLAACTLQSETALLPTPLPGTATTSPAMTTILPTATAAQPAVTASAGEAPATSQPIIPLPAREEPGFRLVGQLGGAANAVGLDGNIVYVGIGTRLVTVDISDPTAPRFFGQSDALAGMVHAVAVQDGMAYVGAGGDLFLYDVSDPAAPVRVGTLNSLAGPDQVSKTDVMPAGELVYVTNRLVYPRGTSLIAIDVSDPAQPVVAARRDLALTAAVTLSGGVLYIVNEGKLQLVDAATPGNTLGEIELEFKLSSSYWRYFVTVVGDLAYVGVSQQPLQVWDVSNPAQPARIPGGQIDLPPSDIGMIAAGETLFLVDMSNGECNYVVRVIDISDVASLRYAAESDRFNCITDFAAGGDILVASTEGGFQVYDAGDPARLPTIGGFVHPAGFNSVSNVALHHDVVYIVLGHGEDTRLGVLDRTQATAPVMVGEPVGLPLPQGSGVEALYVRGDRLFVIPGNGPMLVLDISEPASPRLVRNEGEVINHWATVPALSGKVLYTPVNSGLGVIDLRDPDNPLLFSTLPWAEGICRLSISDRYLIARPCAGPTWVLYDLSDPLRPVEIGRLEAQFRAYAAAGSNFYYASTDTNTLIALDISDPARPGEVGRLALPSPAFEMTWVADTLLLYLRESIWVVNVNDRAHPELEARLPFPVGDVGVDGNLLYLAAGDAGLLIVQLEK